MTHGRPIGWRRRTAGLASLACVAFTAGCAWPLLRADNVPPGSPVSAVVGRLGPPDLRLDHGGGERLIYTLQPMGRQAWAIDVGPDGRTLGTRALLTAEHFGRAQVDLWHDTDLLRAFGPPAARERVPFWTGEVWTWRWSDGGDLLWWAYLDPQGILRRTQVGLEFTQMPDRE